jgi:hypothetical protein
VASKSAPVRQYAKTPSPAITQAKVRVKAAVTQTLIRNRILGVISNPIPDAADRPAGSGHVDGMPVAFQAHREEPGHLRRILALAFMCSWR